MDMTPTGHYKKKMNVVQHGKLPLWACGWPFRLVFGCLLGLKIHGGDGLPDSCLLSLKIAGLACLWLAGGLGTHMDSIGKQVPLPLHHHYMTGTGAGTSCLSLDP